MITLEKAWQCEDLFTKTNFRKEYRELALKYHPDHGGSPELWTKLQRLKDQAEDKIASDTWGLVSFTTAGQRTDAGFFWKRPASNLFYVTGSDVILKTAFNNYQNIKDPSDKEKILERYLPERISETSVFFKSKLSALLIETKPEAIRLDSTKMFNNIPLSPEHVAWICSRLIEFCMLCHHRGYAFLGVTPNNILIHPDTHGITVFNLFHMTKLQDKVTTISNQYKDFYPRSIFGEKKATQAVDLHMIKHLAAWLLGDKTGGANLTNTPKAFADWINSFQTDIITTYPEYRKMLETAFGKPKFHKMILK